MPDRLMMKYKIIGTDSDGDWRRHLPATSTVFGSVEFAQIQEQHSKRRAHLLVLDSGDRSVAYPILLRPLSDLYGVCGFEGRSDSATPEFTGPFRLSAADAVKWSAVSHAALRDIGVISEFMHLHPWNGCDQMLAGGVLRLNREIVWVDTTLSNDTLVREQYNHACRKNLKRAAKENVRIFEASGLGDIREFHRIYRDTMDRNGALSSYYFPLDYFVAVFEQLRAHSRFMLAEWNGQIIGAVLYLHDNDSVYSYLGGADYNFQDVRPTNAIVHNVIGWARENGKQRLILGGGYRPDDGIFRFKASFSQLRANFYTFQRVLDPDAYADLVEGWKRHYGTEPNESYFPAYRSSPPALGAVALLTGD